MSRYVTGPTRPRRDWWDGMPPAQTITHPVVSVGPPVDTGLLDQYGRGLYRVPDEIGFVPRREKK